MKKYLCIYRTELKQTKKIKKIQLIYVRNINYEQVLVLVSVPVLALALVLALVP